MVKILGNGMMSGRVGNLVYYIRNGKCYAREYVSPNNPNTWNQQLSRTRWKTVNHFLSQFTKVIKIGYRSAEENGAYNTAMKYHLQNVLVQTTEPDDKIPSYVIDISKVQLSRGSIQPPEIYSCKRSGQLITLTWNDVLGQYPNRHNDVLNLVVFTPGMKVLHNNIAGNRANGTGEIQLPLLYSEKVHLWAFYWNQKEVSDSVYLGEK